MDILITSPTFPPSVGGVGRVVQQHAEHLSRAGHRVTVLTASEQSDNSDRIAEGGYRVVRLAIAAGRFPAYAAGDWLGIQQPIARTQYQAFLLSCGADVMVSHCWQAWNTDWAVDVAGKLAFPICLFSHGTSVNDTTGKTGWLRHLRWRTYAWRRMPATLKRLSLLINVDALADRNRFYDVTLAARHDTPTVVVANVASAELETAAPWEPPSLNTRHMALSVGQFTPEKNPAQVLDAFLRHATPDWTLVICGSYRTRYLDRLEAHHARAARLRSVAPVTFLTGLSSTQLRGLYKRADLFLAASRTECQPLVILDAMAAALPFVSTNVGCVHRLAGGVVAANAAEFGEAAARLMKDDSLRSQLSREGHEAYEANHRSSVTLQRLESALQDVVQQWRLGCPD